MQTCQIVAFPAARRLTDVRRCAETLDGKQGRDAEAYWRAHCRELADHLLSLGCAEEEVSIQVMDFQHAVQVALMNLHHGEQTAETHQA